MFAIPQPLSDTVPGLREGVEPGGQPGEAGGHQPRLDHLQTVCRLHMQEVGVLKHIS